jgi:hypothetical protein
MLMLNISAGFRRGLDVAVMCQDKKVGGWLEVVKMCVEQAAEKSGGCGGGDVGGRLATS